MLDESVSTWIAQLTEGDDDAAERLWERYFQRLVGVGRRVLRNVPKRASDEEDVALSAFKSFCLRAQDGRFPELADRDDLWKLLITITVRKATRASKKHNRVRLDERSFVQDQLACAEPSPEFVFEMEDQIEQLMDRLRDQRLQQIATWKLDGMTHREIAQKMGRSVSFVERKLQVIRRVWGDEASSESTA